MDFSEVSSIHANGTRKTTDSATSRNTVTAFPHSLRRLMFLFARAREALFFTVAHPPILRFKNDCGHNGHNNK